MGEVRELHEDLAVYAGRVLTQELDKARFLEGRALFLSSLLVHHQRTTAHRAANQPGTAT